MLLYLALLFCADRLPVPGDADIQKSSALVKEIYGADQTAARTAISKSALAKRLLADAGDTKDDTAAQWVMLRASSTIAASAGDTETAIKACNEIESKFIVHDTKLPILRQLVESKVNVATIAIECAETAAGRDAYQVALDYLDIAESSAKRDVELLKSIKAKRKHISTLSVEFESLAAHLATLKTAPLDDKANLAVGSFLCFRKNDWQGLTYLAVVKNSPLGKVAEKDLIGTSEPKSQVAIGDGWWDAGDESTKDACQKRAAHWYRQALPSLAGIERTRIEKRLESLPKEKHSHYFATAKQSDILFRDWDGKSWSVNCASGFAIRQEKNGYRVGARFTGGHSLKVIMLAGTDAKKTRMTAIISVNDGFVDCGIRYKDERDGGIGAKRIERGQSVKIEMAPSGTFINGARVECEGELPTSNACYAFVVPQIADFTIHELYFE